MPHAYRTVIGLGAGQLALALMLGSPAPVSAQPACAPDGEVEFVCGPVSPEDLVSVPGTPWVIAAGMEDDGYLYAVGAESHEVDVLYPAAGARERLDATTYPACPGPDTSGYRPHGLNLRAGDGDRHTLYVVRHGAREAIEVYDLDAGTSPPGVTWVGCVPAPEGVTFNSVAALPDGGIAATHFNRPVGEVWEWTPGGEWVQVPGSETNGPNGLVASPDGEWLFVGGWGTHSVIRLSRGRTPVEATTIDVGFHVDNVRWAPDGSLLAAGHAGDAPTSIFACLGQGACDDVSSRVARVDPEALTAAEIVRYPSNEHLILGTVALEVGDEIWVGGIAGGDRIARFAKAGPPRTAWGAVDLQGVWDFRTLTPLERPEALGDQAVLSEEEAAAFTQQTLEARNADRRDGAEQPFGVGSDVERAYNQFWWDYGSSMTEDRRSSLIVDPTTGRIPYTPEGRERAAALFSELFGNVAAGPEDRALAERCVLGFNSGPPMLPSAYNNNVQLFQTPDTVVILNEMVHNARIVPLDGRPFVSVDVRQWVGDSRGRWEGDTLVVETVNFHGRTSFPGSSARLRLVERFTRVDEDTLVYAFTVEDDATWSSRWTAEVPMRRSDAPLYEYACHEGNYGMTNLLAGARMEDREPGAR